MSGADGPPLIPGPRGPEQPRVPVSEGFGTPAGPALGGPPGQYESYSGPTPPGQSPPPDAKYYPGPTAPPGPTGPGFRRAGPATSFGKNNTIKLVLILGAAVLVLAVVVTTVGLLANRAKTAGGSTSPAATGPTAPAGASVPAVLSKPSDPVKAYLQALAAGDAEAALAVGDRRPLLKTFMTDAVLAESHKRAPITNINVPEVTDDYTYTVRATYRIGNRNVTDMFDVRKVGGSWKLRETFAELDVSDVRSQALPMLVNSAVVRMDKIWVLPGSYEFTTGRPFVDYGAESVVLVTSPSDLVPLNITPTVTKEGSAAFVKAAKQSLKRCLGRREMLPAHCPFGLREGPRQKVDKSTIRWQLVRSPFDSLKPRLDAYNPLLVTASAPMTVSFTARGRQNGIQGTFTQQKARATVHMFGAISRGNIIVMFSG